jgi:hypothetical protein
MANYRAIATVCESIVHLLHANYQPDLFNNELEFKVYAHDDFVDPMDAGVSLFLYRILPNGTHRVPSGRLRPDGQRYQTQMPLDLCFLLTVWGRSASLQHQVAGWMMRTLEDTPILPAGFLNSVAPNAFQSDETVEIILADLSTEDLLRLWETLLPNRYQLSVPYKARNVRIESTELLTIGEPLQERVFDHGSFVPGSS